MFLSNTLSDNLGLGDAAVISVLGYAVVFFGLILLMAVVITLGKAFSSKKEKVGKPAVEKATPPVASAPIQAATATDTLSASAPGSAGKLKLHDVEPKTAAMLMAIVASKMGKPLNELRFISIKEVKEK